MLIILSGLPGTGKTTIARELAQELGAVYLRIDSIEQCIRSAGWPVEGEGYRVAYAVAEDDNILDLNILTALLWPAHEHHDTAHRMEPRLQRYPTAHGRVPARPGESSQGSVEGREHFLLMESAMRSSCDRGWRAGPVMAGVCPGLDTFGFRGASHWVGNESCEGRQLKGRR